jgi:hypothetical protein
LIALTIGASIVAADVSAQTARVFYVSPTGIDSSSGSELQPFRTIQRAADLVNPGDTVIVEDGLYTGTGSGTVCASTSRPVVCLTRGGVSGNLVTIKARHVGGAKLDGQNNTSTDGFRFLANANYIDLEGFEIYGVGNAAGSASGIELYNGGHDVVIAHNHLHDIGRLCTDTSNGEVGIFIEQPRVRVESNRLHDIGRFVGGENGCSTNYAASRDHAIYVNGSQSGSAIPGASDTFIVNNLFYNNLRGWAIQVYPGTVSGLSILNNTFAFPNPYQDGHIILGANMSDAQIINNIFYKPRKAAINYYTGTQTNLQVTMNLVFNATLLNTTPPGAMVVANQVGDPLLSNADIPPFDFHLMAGSFAINAGLTLAEVPVDLDSIPRTSGAYDVGAYEFSSGALAKVATPTISPNGGTLTGSVSVALASSTIGATIRYTTDGTTPGTSSPIYSAPFTVATSVTVQAQAVASGMTDSAVAQAIFQAQAATAAAPTITPNGGVISGPVSVSLATSTAGATIRYTTDGTTPGSSSPIYTAPFTVTTSATVKAQAVASGMTDSAVAQATFQIQSDTIAPIVSFTAPLDGASVSRNGPITFSVAASDNVRVISVRFTLDGQTIATDTSAPYSMTYNFNKAAAGKHVISAVASDAAGNIATATITVWR